MPNAAIDAGSIIKISFSDKFNINSTSLQNCRASTASGVAATTVACSVTYNSGSKLYEVTMNGLFPSAGTFSSLVLEVLLY